jgi:hypothetical protein
MQSFLTKAFLITGIVLVANGVASAQWYPNDPYSGRDAYRYENHRTYAFQLFDQVQVHLARAAHNAYGSRNRIERARKDVYDFQRRLNEGRFDRHELDEAIGSVQRVVDRNSIDPRIQYLLLDDLARMREFRASRGGYDRRWYEPQYER